jgi:hypothetical protein
LFVEPSSRQTPFAFVEKSQQPAAQEVAVHLHWPFTHCSFAPQTEPPGPHEQLPFRQRSAFCVSQVEHAPPIAPQLSASRDTHWPLAVQQPVVHEVASQTQVPPTQR